VCILFTATLSTVGAAQIAAIFLLAAACRLTISITRESSRSSFVPGPPVCMRVRACACARVCACKSVCVSFFVCVGACVCESEGV